MGIFSFFKSGGALGQMAEVTGKLYLKTSTEGDDELKRLVVILITRFMISSGGNKKDRVTFALDRLRVMNGEGAIGVMAVCYTIASIEMDVVGIEDYVIKTIKDNLEKLGLTHRQIFGRQYNEQFFADTVREFGME
jgi:hypothetical protein